VKIALIWLNTTISKSSPAVKERWRNVQNAIKMQENMRIELGVLGLNLFGEEVRT
jgi:hypothetical protein